MKDTETDEQSDGGGAGTRLIAWIAGEQAKRGLNKTQVAKAIGISRPLLHALENGDRSTFNLERRILLGIARFVHQTPLAVYMAAGVVYPEDFYQLAPGALEAEVERAYEFLANNPDWAERYPMPAEKDLSLRMKLYFVLTFQDATGRQLLPPGMTREQLLAQAQP